jgi:hypothetical protein
VAKISAKNVFNALKKIGVGVPPSPSGSPIGYPIRDYSLTLEEIQEALSKNTSFSNYDLLKYFLSDVMRKNQHNHHALFVCYELMGKYGQIHNVDSYREHFEKAMYYHLKWKLTHEYAMVLSDRGCQQCIHLNDSICNTKDALAQLPLKAKACEFGMFRCTVVSMPEASIRRRLDQ